MADDRSRRQAMEGVTASEVELYIGDIDFPCGREDLINHARDRRAPFGVLQVLEEFPNKQFASTVDIVHGINHAKRHRHV